MSVKVYDPNKISIIVGVIPITSGFADGKFVEIKQNSPLFKTKVGSDGQATRSKTNDKSGTCTITLMQTSEGNDLLTALLNVDDAGNNGAGIVPLTIRDQQGNFLFFAEHAWIEGPPDVDFDREATERAWSIAFAKSTRVDGGA